MSKQRIHSSAAPKAIGSYSQAIQAGNTVYLSGQIPLDPATMTMVEGSFDNQLEQVFMNLREVCMAAGGNFENIVKLTIYLTDLQHFPAVNEAMVRLFKEPYPARATIQVSALPKAALNEVDAVMVL
jgi:reactive intermediate/imine deaminase